MVAAKQEATADRRRQHINSRVHPTANYTCVILSTEMARPRTIDKTGKQPASKQVALRLTEAQYKRLRKRAQAKGKTVAELLRDLAQVA